MQERDRIMSMLKSPFHQVKTRHGSSYGGDQAWLPYKFLKSTGCGIISAADVILHLQGVEEISQEEYEAFAKKLWMNYLPVIPGFGMNGLMLMFGLNLYFKTHKMPYMAYWNIFSRNMFLKIDRMISKDLPAILAIGPNFPLIWKKEKLTFYGKTNNGDYVPVTKIKAHFVTVTGREGEWIRISSWGKEYYFRVSEYREYVKKYSHSFVSNAIILQKKNKSCLLTLISRRDNIWSFRQK